MLITECCIKITHFLNAGQAGGERAGEACRVGENKKISSEKIGADFAGSEQSIRLLVALSHRVQT